MPDDVFAVPRLARIYDEVDGDRDDLDAYEAIIDEFDARSVLDIGCGTGTFACRLARRGLHVAGVDPAAASLDVARAKPGAELVEWVFAPATQLPRFGADLAVMTGNVAMVFLDDDEWATVLRSAARALRPGGLFVFETRVPGARGWEAWTQAATDAEIDTVEGRVRYWVETIEVALPFVAFEQHHVFERDGVHSISPSTLRFRDRDEIEDALRDAGFEVVDVRGAPDRPGLEFVFIARVPGGADDRLAREW